MTINALQVGKFYTFKIDAKPLCFSDWPMFRNLIGQKVSTITPGFRVQILHIGNAYNSIDGVLEFAFISVKFQLYIFNESIKSQYYHWDEDSFKKVFNEQ